MSVIWCGWRGMWKRPYWIARDVPMPGGRRLVFEIGFGPLSVAKVEEARS